MSLLPYTDINDTIMSSFGGSEEEALRLAKEKQVELSSLGHIVTLDSQVVEVKKGIYACNLLVKLKHYR